MFQVYVYVMLGSSSYYVQIQVHIHVMYVHFHAIFQVHVYVMSCSRSRYIPSSHLCYVMLRFMLCSSSCSNYVYSRSCYVEVHVHAMLLVHVMF